MGTFDSSQQRRPATGKLDLAEAEYVFFAETCEQWIDSLKETCRMESQKTRCFVGCILGGDVAPCISTVLSTGLVYICWGYPPPTKPFFFEGPPN